MIVQRKHYKVKLGKLIISVTAIGSILFSFYVMNYRNDWMFGITDTLFNNKKGIVMKTVHYNDSDLEMFSLEDISSDKTTIKYSNSLLLINSKYKIGEMPRLNLSNFRDTTLLLDKDVLEDLEKLLSSVRESTNQKVYIMSTYRTKEDQERIYKEEPKVAAPVNASEHQTGLALDLYAHQKAQREFIDTDAGKWIHYNGWQHGFIIRYPFLKKHLTGISYEPWHVRYVGKPHAKIIYNNNWTLEEYIETLRKDIFYSVDDYIISRQSGKTGKINIPKGLESVSLSPDNTGCYIVTGKVNNE